MSQVAEDWNQSAEHVEKVSEVIVKNEKGEEVKITKRYRELQVVVKKNRKVDERRKWDKFGEYANQNPFANTSYGDEVFLTLARNTEAKEEKKDIVQCRICKKNHFTTKCPYKDAIDLTQKSQKSAETEEKNKQQQQQQSGGPRYVPPSQRSSGGLGGSSSGMGGELPLSLMVSNLSENANEDDLRELFSRCGAVQKVNIPKNDAGKPRGYAYVTYYNIKDAEKAIKELKGHRYDYLVLSVEFAKRKTQNY
ncbi:RNA-binding region RNP-1 domain-containing protein [Tieghemostelium lacteum]|uniref:Eukaryotic translation initiation factor 3 subunit G n=1 Tax=Tieghemostelium lacteum TaxID=361077 RepID=A0A152A3T3_TIELA|nr:RNA-binding region RNP-1 domain-containing protein [Tieghemostelium lacteum]|eukprot:KYR00932.1 RNA-binding region RNP-1 domain-containing protein [Tieghemostelium lacteum]